MSLSVSNDDQILGVVGLTVVFLCSNLFRTTAYSDLCSGSCKQGYCNVRQHEYNHCDVTTDDMMSAESSACLSL